MNGQYELKNSENQEQSVGTIKQPFFMTFPRANLIKKSLLFYAQIDQAYLMYHIKTANRRTLNLKFKDRSCPAKAHAYISPEIFSTEFLYYCLADINFTLEKVERTNISVFLNLIKFII